MGRKTEFRAVRLSLADLLGAAYTDAVVDASGSVSGERRESLRRIAREKVDFFTADFQRALARLLPRVGSRVVAPFARSAGGASSRAFSAAAKTEMAPLCGWGYYRVGEDGRLYFISKSEHYHAALGHAFPGYHLLDHARRLGIPNATHNNARGHVTRLLEEELVRTANGLPRGDGAALGRLLRSQRPGALNRVLNLETGSLAVEAGVKMMLGRFYRMQDDSPPPRYEGRVPVIVVIGDTTGGLQANYHGTTINAQMLRGMWSGLRDACRQQGIFEVVPVKPNDREGLERVFGRYDRGRRKIAGFIHEIVMMNYGALLLSRTFLRRAYALCREHDVPTLVDEIQSCLWSTGLYMFREYGLRPAMVTVGKGLPGGEYPASRIIFCTGMDTMPQFGALVTNGQEEIASLAYLITMRWAEENSAATREIGDAYEAGLRALVRKHPRHLAAVEGRRHIASVCFHEMEKAKAFVKLLADGGLDISLQTYKANCPPGALTKLPLIAGHQAARMVVSRMDEALRRL